MRRIRRTDDFPSADEEDDDSPSTLKVEDDGEDEQRGHFGGKSSLAELDKAIETFSFSEAWTRFKDAAHSHAAEMHTFSDAVEMLNSFASSTLPWSQAATSPPPSSAIMLPARTKLARQGCHVNMVFAE